MCGIALIINGVVIDSTLVNTSTENVVDPLHFTVEDLKAALRRRGPDSLGTKKVILELKDATDTELRSYVAGDDEAGREKSRFLAMDDFRPFVNGEDGVRPLKFVAEMHFTGAVLQLRGTNTVVQPLVDAHENVLIYNGEIFGGIHMSSDSNDAEILMQSLGNCCCCRSHENVSTCGGKPVPVLLSSIKGPWAVIYWQNASRTLWFGRDAIGRRSLLVHWPTSEDTGLLLSSVSAPSSDAETDNETETRASSLTYWSELPCGVYSLSMDASRADGCLVGKVRKHEWSNSMLKELIKWERMFIEPLHDKPNPSGTLQRSLHDKKACDPVHMVLEALRKSIARRTTKHTIFKLAVTIEVAHNIMLAAILSSVQGDWAAISGTGQGVPVPVAVLFSGGLDSMILAAILHECLDARFGIDLLNVSFEGEAAPDRITARAGVQELRRIAPVRKWRLVEINATLSNLTMEMKHVMSLINPAKTYMDLNIGLALWLAAQGDGWVYEADSCCLDEYCRRFRYKSEARILLVGSGADEQCAGYGRHRTKYRNSSWLGLHEEMKLDMQRIWKRNLGRDDRCIADSGKEARFPFLDEDVIRILLDFPLWEIANLDQPSGIGDKKILREVARLLGLHEAAVQPKRAIQFGSRIAQESNRKNFGSNRAANQASAGSVVFHKSSS